MLSMTLHLPKEEQTLRFDGSSRSDLGKEQTLRFEGSSRSNLGKFRLYGRCSQDAAANSFHFTMKREFVSDHPSQYWHGQFDVATETITGTWGTDSEVSAHFGTFILKRTAPEALRFRPAPATIEANKARSLWVYAINAVKAQVRRQLWSWKHFKERRDKREEFITLYTRNSHYVLILDPFPRRSCTFSQRPIMSALIMHFVVSILSMSMLFSSCALSSFQSWKGRLSPYSASHWQT
ncbi:hypothetical protein JB92DRAFT_1665232 [Gautieria morchelliformis]|nr:hypothetical protein JB92DRAFT_1665232 [Gautieria morchelliformis]